MQTVITRWGENHQKIDSSERCYFFAVSNTGQQMNIKSVDRKILSLKTWRTLSDIDTKREHEVIYDITYPIIFKMILIGSGFGKRKISLNIFLTISEEFPRIRIEGLEGFGLFDGNAIIDYEESKYSLEELRKYVNVEFINQAKSNTKSLRKILY